MSGLLRVLAVGVGLLLLALPASAQPAGGLQIALGSGSEASYLKLLLLFASVSLAPALLAVLTSFVRIVVVLFFLRAGLGSPQIIPNPVLFGLAILLTIFTMARPLDTISRSSLQPFFAGRIPLAQAAKEAAGPLREYLSAHTRLEDLALFQSFEVKGRPQPAQAAPASRAAQAAPSGGAGGAARANPATPGAPAFSSLAAAYVISELRAAFLIGFIIYLPFLVIDLVVAGTLASLGLLSLPQAAVALPFKVLLFVMVDGWRLLTDALLTSLR